MNIHLSQIVIVNRAPFQELTIKFRESEIAVLTAINGRGKTTVLSYIVDAFYEMTKRHFSDVTKDSNSYYRVSSGLDTLEHGKPSLVYLRFQSKGQCFDYIDVRGPCTAEDYAKALGNLDSRIDFANNIQSPLTLAGNAKVVSPNLTKEIAEQIFFNNVATYFPSYRFETPSYLNKPFQERLAFRTETRYTGRLDRPLEASTSLNEIANWLMDVVLDLQVNPQSSQLLFYSLNIIISSAVSSKNLGSLRFGIGERHLGSSRVQILRTGLEQPDVTLYPSIFRLSSGESALFCLFAEILRHADLLNLQNNPLAVSGIVLVDEIDKHLHIKLQKEVLPVLLSFFPNIQFIVSSHSPFLNMGLAEHLNHRSRVIDIQTGLAISPTTDPQYQEVYTLMLNEATNFKLMYESLQAQTEEAKALQLISEGKNIHHIEQAIRLLAPELLPKIKFISGVEDRTGETQLKNAFEIMAQAKHAGKFLFVWDCDSTAKVGPVIETENFHKYCFDLNIANTVAKKGIENLYGEELFTDDVYDKKTTHTDYGGSKEERTFNKAKFADKIKNLDDPKPFNNFKPLLDKIQILVNG